MARVAESTTVRVAHVPSQSTWPRNQRSCPRALRLNRRTTSSGVPRLGTSVEVARIVYSASSLAVIATWPMRPTGLEDRLRHPPAVRACVGSDGERPGDAGRISDPQAPVGRPVKLEVEAPQRTRHVPVGVVAWARCHIPYNRSGSPAPGRGHEERSPRQADSKVKRHSPAGNSTARNSSGQRVVHAGPGVRET